MPFAAACLLARLRARRVESGGIPHDVLFTAATAAADAGRSIIRLHDAAHGRDVLVLGWQDGVAPPLERLPSATPLRIPRIPTLTWAACLRAAWPDPSLSPYPGRSFTREEILAVCTGLGADEDAVKMALDQTLPSVGLITGDGAERVLGPAVAALPGTVIEGLRRAYYILPASTGSSLPSREQPEPVRGALPVAAVASNRHDHLVDLVQTAVNTLEVSQRPIVRAELPMLADPALRAKAHEMLSRCGRQLVQTAEGNWTTGYPDDIADHLVATGCGTLNPLERAVLGLVLLHTVAIPRAKGRHRHDRWTGETHTVTTHELAINRKLTQKQIRSALRTLRSHGLVAEATSGKYIPGPGLDRLSKGRKEMLWEEPILVGRPGGYLAAAIRRRREHSGFGSTGVGVEP